MSSCFYNILSKYQYGFRQGLSAQCCLLSMIEKRKKATDKGKTFAALLIDLSETFDCLPHDLIIAKFNAFSLSLDSSRLIHSYLSNRKQRTRINTLYNSW